LTHYHLDSYGDDPLWYAPAEAALRQCRQFKN
jgi:hypothetical protein